MCRGSACRGQIKPAMPLILAPSASGGLLPRPRSPSSELFVLISCLTSGSAQSLLSPVSPGSGSEELRPEVRASVRLGDRQPWSPSPPASHMERASLPPHAPGYCVAAKEACAPGPAERPAGPSRDSASLGQEQRHPRHSLDLSVRCHRREARAGAYSLSIYLAPLYTVHPPETMLERCVKSPSRPALLDCERGAGPAIRS